jgi:hypothetical protein
MRQSPPGHDVMSWFNCILTSESVLAVALMIHVAVIGWRAG